jgi:uncharacterized membrane protein
VGGIRNPQSRNPSKVYFSIMHLTLLILFSVLFPVTHIVLSHSAIRASLIRAVRGEWPFRGLHSLVSFVTLGGAVAVFWGHRHLGPVLWEVSPLIERIAALPLMLLALVLLVLAVTSPSPASMVPGRLEARGIVRVTRHPMNVAFALFGLAHLAANGALGDLFFFGQFVVLGLLGPLHQDARLARERGEAYLQFLRQTSLLPFAAIASGRNRFAARELALPMVLTGVAAFVALMVFHGRLFGVDLL